MDNNRSSFTNTYDTNNNASLAAARAVGEAAAAAAAASGASAALGAAAGYGWVEDDTPFVEIFRMDPFPKLLKNL